MFDLTSGQTEEEWNKTGVWVLKTRLIKGICVEGLTQCSMNVYTSIICTLQISLIGEEEE